MVLRDMALFKEVRSEHRSMTCSELRIYMIKSCTCICKGRQDKVRHSPKADSEKSTELPWMGFEPVTTGLLV